MRRRSTMSCRTCDREEVASNADHDRRRRVVCPCTFVTTYLADGHLSEPPAPVRRFAASSIVTGHATTRLILKHESSFIFIGIPRASDAGGTFV